MIRIISLCSLSLIIFSSCRIFHPSIMLRTGCKYPYDIHKDTVTTGYRLAPNDIIQFRVLSNDGFKLIDFNAFGDNQSWATATATNFQTYVIDIDGTAKLPLLGRVQLSGMTLRGTEMFLEEKYSTYYNKPFVMVNITNRRVIVFPGGEGLAKVIPLNNPNTTLLEAMAMAGGISMTGKSWKIKLIRGDLKNPMVFLMDLSTIDGMKKANMILQANDIIYVEPTISVTKTILSEFSPVLGIINGIVDIFLVYFLIVNQ